MQEIICVLDKSGSMQLKANDAVGGFNKFLQDQKAIGEAKLTVVWFSDKFEVGYEGRLSEAQEIVSWPNGGSTAMYDAIGKTFSHVGPRFSKESPAKVIMAILTDGEENASREFGAEKVAALVKEHQEKYGWTIIYLAADQDAWKAAQQIGILKANTASYSSSNTRGGLADYSHMVTNARVN